jgi:hypothetical protein
MIDSNERHVSKSGNNIKKKRGDGEGVWVGGAL